MIGGVDKTDALLARSLRISKTSNGIDRFSCEIESEDGTYRSALDADVVLTADGITIFGGLLQEWTESGLQGHGAGIRTAIEAQDYSLYPSFRLISETLSAGTLKSMLTTIVDNYLDDYGVSLHGSQPDGPDLNETTVTLQRGDAVLNQLATMAGGYVWTIDADKKLLMQAGSAASAPFDITESNATIVGDIVVTPTRNEVDANRVLVQVTGGGPPTSTETFTADGSSSATYTTKYPSSDSVADIWPNELIVNGVNKGPVGFGSSSGFPWYWDADTHSLVATGDGYVPANGDVIRVKYTIGYPYEVSADNLTDQATRGIREVLFTVNDGLAIDAAQDLADALVAQGVPKLVQVEYDTYESGIKPGQTQHITESYRDLDADFLILDVDISDPNGDGILLSHVTAIQADTFQPGWRQTIRDWSGGGSSSSAVTAAGIAQAATVALPGISPLGGSRINGMGFQPDDTYTLNESRVLRVDWDNVRSEYGLRARVWPKVDSGATITPRVYNLTDAEDAIVGDAYTATSFPSPGDEQVLVIPRASGVVYYEGRAALSGASAKDAWCPMDVEVYVV
jgi:hypothetical protein